MANKSSPIFAAMCTVVSFATVDANKATATGVDGLGGKSPAEIAQRHDHGTRISDAKISPDMGVNSTSKLNNINAGMPNRISMNITVPKQTQGATFGERVQAGRIDIVLSQKGCLVLLSTDAGYEIDLNDNSFRTLSVEESAGFNQKVNQGLHATGGMLSQGASLLGGALPGGSIISAAVSSVSNLAGGAGGGAASASYAKTGAQLWTLGSDSSDYNLNLAEGNFELLFVIAKMANSNLRESLKTQVQIGFSIENGALKTKHDNVKNSVNSIM